MRVKEYLRRKVAFFASVIEIAISIIVLIAIVIAGIQVVREVFSLAGDPKAHEGFTIRKFLFVPSFGEHSAFHEEEETRAGALSAAGAPRRE